MRVAWRLGDRSLPAWLVRATRDRGWVLVVVHAQTRDEAQHVARERLVQDAATWAGAAFEIEPAGS